MITNDNQVHPLWIYEGSAYANSYPVHTNIHPNLHNLRTAMCSRSMGGTMKTRHEMMMAVQPERSFTWTELFKIRSMIERAGIGGGSSISNQ